jgi:ribosome biogenesis protein ENP2
MAQADRSIDFHAQYGAHYRTRIPHYPRDLEYSPHNATLCVSASSNEVYRISLEEGKFLVPIHTSSFINSMHYNEKLGVLACGGDQLEIWDFRDRKIVCKLQTSGVVSHVKCDESGLLMGVGEGSTLNIFDVRFDRKLFSIRSSYNEPINSIHFMENTSKNILFSNKKQIKITDGEGKLFTSV